MLQFRITNVGCYVNGDDTREGNLEIANLSHCLSYVPKGQYFWKKESKEKYHTFSLLYQGANFTVFPSGLVDYVLNTRHRQKVGEGFDTYTIEADVVDAREVPRAEMNPVKLWNEKEDCPIVLHDYQEEAIRRFLDRTRGIIRLATGSGKTILAIALTQILGVRTLFVVNNKTLLKDTVKQFKLKAGIDAGSIGDNEWSPDQVTVATVQTLSRRIKDKETLTFLGNQEFVIFDEVQHSSTTYQKVSRALKNAYWRLGLSATVMMGTKEEKLKSMAMTGPMIYDVQMKKMVDDEQLAKPTAIFIEIPRHDNDPRWDLMEFAELYSEGIVHNEFRNMVLAHAIIEMRTRGYGSLVLVEKLDHGENILKLVKEHRSEWNVQYISGKDNADIRDQAKTDLQSTKLDVLITSRIFNEGVDIPLLESVVVAAGYKKEGLTYQRYGRGVRKTKKKTHTIIIDCYDSFSDKLQKHSEERLSVCRKSKAFDIYRVQFNEISKTLDEVFEKRRSQNDQAPR